MHYKEYKSILSAQNGMNLYRGCTHGCIYCDSRSTCYQIKHDFEDIEVKLHAPEILEKQLLKKRQPCMIGTGAMSDPYIPLENTLEYTRTCLRIIDRHHFGLAILTKSNRIMRDIDLLQSINQNAKCVVQMTLTTYDEALCAILEPAVCTTRERFDVLDMMRQKKIPTVVWLSPILPFINDTEENLFGLLEYCIKAQVWGIINFGFGMTLREGNRTYFYATLDRYFPGLSKVYQRTYGDNYIINSRNNNTLMRIFYAECRRHGIVCNNAHIFSFLHTLPQTHTQLTLF